MTKILLVDDQPMIVDMLSEFLHDEGYDVHTHTDGLTALQQMLELRPDLVITDFNMPGMDGGALLTAMRENAYLNETPVLILSGRPEHEVEEACQGHAAHLRKPAELTARRHRWQCSASCRCASVARSSGEAVFATEKEAGPDAPLR
ncbi:MAG: response regulator, partial [Bordetella sp.]|nr:response regulator [Bordetella sp.]